MRISIIAAVARNGVIGVNNDLPWKLPDDFRNFKALTLGHTLLMGRRTFESLPKPLPGRTTIVLSRRPRCLPDGVHLVDSFESGVELARQQGEDELFIAGGRGVYGAALSIADRMILTRVDADPEGDTYFPEFCESAWREIGREDFEADDRHAYPFAITVLEPVSPSPAEAPTAP